MQIQARKLLKVFFSSRSIRLQQPHVDLTMCIGCGACEKHCPVVGQPAIAVTSAGESRTEEHQLLLQAPAGSPDK